MASPKKFQVVQILQCTTIISCPVFIKFFASKWNISSIFSTASVQRVHTNMYIMSLSFLPKKVGNNATPFLLVVCISFYTTHLSSSIPPVHRGAGSRIYQLLLIHVSCDRVQKSLFENTGVLCKLLWLPSQQRWKISCWKMMRDYGYIYYNSIFSSLSLLFLPPPALLTSNQLPLVISLFLPARFSLSFLIFLPPLLLWLFLPTFHPLSPPKKNTGSFQVPTFNSLFLSYSHPIFSHTPPLSSPRTLSSTLCFKGRKCNKKSVTTKINFFNPVIPLRFN